MSPIAARQYELVYIIAPEASDQEVAGLHTEIESIVSRFNGHIERSENWGKRRLAYSIGPHKEGLYVFELINGNGDLMKELDRRLRVSDQVIRHLVVRVDEEARVAERRASERKGRREQRRGRGGATEEIEGPSPEAEVDETDAMSDGQEE